MMGQDKSVDSSFPTSVTVRVNPWLPFSFLPRMDTDETRIKERRKSVDSFLPTSVAVRVNPWRVLIGGPARRDAAWPALRVMRLCGGEAFERGEAG